MAEGAAADEEVENVVAGLGSYRGKVGLVSDCEEEIMLLWAIQQPIFSKHNAFVSQSALQLHIDACGRSLSILQSPSSLVRPLLVVECVAGFIWFMNPFEAGVSVHEDIDVSTFAAVLYYGFSSLVEIVAGNSLLCGLSYTIYGTPGVTGSVMWDSGIILGKFLEHSVESGKIFLQGKNVIELGSGCGLVGCIAALLGAQVILTDLPDRLKLLKKNVETNLYGDVRGSATVNELTWGDDLDTDFTDPSPDFVVGSDVVYSEGAVLDLMETIVGLCGKQTTIILAGELRNDAILEYFLEAAMKEFIVGRVDQDQWHPDYRSSRVAIYVLVKK
ncbi:UNVERIFIED_CONTAM: Protein N-lysine methyltransferase METTL21A [Sesamum indicum]